MNSKTLDDVIDREIEQQRDYENQLEDQLIKLSEQNQILQERLEQQKQILETRLENYHTIRKTSQKKKIPKKMPEVLIWKTTVVPFILGFILGNSILIQKIFLGKIKLSS